MEIGPVFFYVDTSCGGEHGNGVSRACVNFSGTLTFVHHSFSFVFNFWSLARMCLRLRLRGSATVCRRRAKLADHVHVEDPPPPGVHSVASLSFTVRESFFRGSLISQHRDSELEMRTSVVRNFSLHRASAEGSLSCHVTKH